MGRWHKIDICVSETVRHLLYMVLCKALGVHFGVDLNYKINNFFTHSQIQGVIKKNTRIVAWGRKDLIKMTGKRKM